MNASIYVQYKQIGERTIRVDPKKKKGKRKTVGHMWIEKGHVMPT